MPDKKLRKQKKKKTTHPTDIYMQYLFPLLEVDFYSLLQKYPYASCAKNCGHRK